jgi:hypothetical protein
MAVPGLCSLYYLFLKSPLENPLGTRLTSVPCLLHFPWSAGLHVYRAIGTDPVRRTILYKWDVSFHHIYSIFTRYAFSLKFSWLETIFHVSYILHLWLWFDPLNNPESKQIVGILSAIGLGSCAFALFMISHSHFLIAFGVAAAGFLVQHTNLFGPFSPLWFHICLAAPHYCILYGLNLPKPTWYNHTFIFWN